MRRVLIADPFANDSEFGEYLTDSLGDIFQFAFCCHGKDFHKILREFDPDVLFLNMRLPNVNCLDLLHEMHISGNMIPVVLITNSLDVYISAQTLQLNIAGVLHSPYTQDALVAQLKLIADTMELQSDQPVDNELDYILLRMGFKAGSSRYEATRCGVLEKFKTPQISLTKELYPTVGKQIGKGGACVEKCIRDSVRMAREVGDPDLWLAFFPTLKPTAYPANEEFLGRLAIALQHRQRPRKPAYKWKQLINL